MSFRKRPCNQLIEVSLTRVSRKKACDVIVNYRYHKIPKKSPGAYIFRGLFLRSLSLEGLMFAGGGGGGGLYTVGKLRFTIDRASLKTGRKFTVFALFCYVFKDNF